MTLADFLRSGNLVSLLKDEDYTSEEGTTEMIIMMFSYVDVLSEREKIEYLKKINMDLKDFSIVNGFLYNNIISSYGYKDYKVDLQRITIDSGAFLILSNIFHSLSSAERIGIHDAFYRIPVENFRVLIGLIDYYFNFERLALNENSDSSKPQYSYKTIEPEDNGFLWIIKAGLVTISIAALYYIMYSLNEMLRKRKLRLDKLDFSLKQAKGTSEEKKNHSLEDIETLRRENIILLSEISNLESKKKAQAQKIKEKITKLGEKDDDKELIEMVDKYVNQFYTEKVLEFEDKKKLHRSTVEQDTLHHNKTHLNLISNFFNTLEVNDLF